MAARPAAQPGAPNQRDHCGILRRAPDGAWPGREPGAASRPRASKRWTAECIDFLQSPRCRLSSSECAAQPGSSTPVSRGRAERVREGLDEADQAPEPTSAGLPVAALERAERRLEAGPDGSLVHQGVVRITCASTGRRPAASR